MTPLDLLNTALPVLRGGLTQTQRLMRVHTPLGADVLFAEDLQAWEGVGPAEGPALADGTGPTRAGLRLVVNALATDAHLELKTLIGQPALVELLCQDSALDMRPWHGHIVSASLQGSDGGLARYRLVIEPWLAVLAHKTDAWVYQDMSVPQILDDLFSGSDGQGTLVPAWRWELADAALYPQRSLCVQYQESDLDFALRLMREEGLVCWWEHSGDASSPSLGSHTLVIADHNGAVATNIQPTVRFTASDHTLGEDSLERWADLNRVTTARVTLSSRDHRSLGLRPVSADVGADVGTVAAMPELAIVDVPGAYAYEDMSQGQRLATCQAQALAAVRTRALARGSWRRAQAGTSFTLVDHARHDGSDTTRDTFVVLAAQHRARNNFSADEKARFVGLNQAILRDQGLDGKPHRDDNSPLHEAALLVQPLAVPLRMGAADAAQHGVAADGGFGVTSRSAVQPDATPCGSPSLFDPHAVTALAQPEVRLNARPTVHGVQTAIVVGDSGDAGGSDLHTDRDGRVKVQFHWQRGSGSSHRLVAADGDNAPATGASFTWLRVGHSLAGANFGAVFTPRVGQEVLVSFLGGDIDRPVIVGAVYNGQGTLDAQGNQVAGGAAGASGNAPAWFPGTQEAGDLEGHQHNAVMLGHKSQELGASSSGLGGYNQLVFDVSAAGQAAGRPAGHRIELSSSTVSTRLQLGALLQQQDNQRLTPRGHGLDLASAGHGALRAGAGLLLSAHAQSASTAGGQQLESRGPQQQLQSAQELVHTLAVSAQAHNAKLATEPAVAGATAKDKSRQLPAEQGLYALIDSLQGADTLGSGGSGGDSSGDTVTIDGGQGSVPAWGRPDLLLAAPSGVGLFTPAAAILSAGANTSLSAGQDLITVAQGHHATAVKDGLVLFTYGKATNPSKPNAEVGMALHAASGSVQTSSNTGATRLTASAAVDVSSTKTQVLVASPTQVLLAAAGAAIQIDSGSITLNAPGAVAFKAGMKNLTGAESSSNDLLSLARPTGWSVELGNQFFNLMSHDGKPVANRRYRAFTGNACIEGFTDASGNTSILGGHIDQIAKFELVPHAFDEHFILKDPLGRPMAYMRYKIRSKTGVEISGITDADGHTDLFAGDTPETIDLMLVPSDDVDGEGCD